MKLWDCFLFNHEIEVLECRLETLAPYVDRFVIVEATTTLQGHTKPSYYLDNAQRFSPWKDKIVHVLEARLLDTAVLLEREKRQREATFSGVAEAAPSDMILFGDVDEIPHPESLIALRKTPVTGFAMFPQRFCCFAVDWQYGDCPWYGTVVGPRSKIVSFSDMRLDRKGYPIVPGPQGWHLSWIGGREAGIRKLFSFPHPQLIEKFAAGVASERHYREGVYIDGTKMMPIDVDATWPSYIFERRCPANWFRPRKRTR